MTGSKRHDPNYSQVSGYIPKELFLQFKAACATEDTTLSETLETLIVQWLQDVKSGKTALRSEEDLSEELRDEAIAFIKALVKGAPPSDGQIGELAHLSDFSEEELISLRQRLFPNGGRTNGDTLTNR